MKGKDSALREGATTKSRAPSGKDVGLSGWGSGCGGSNAITFLPGKVAAWKPLPR